MPRSKPHDHYATLGLRRNAGRQDVKRAYRDLAKRYHPDVDPSPLAAERFMAVHSAYSILHDPLLRIAYDAAINDNYRPAGSSGVKRTRDTPRYRQRDPGTDINTRSWAFIGLHLTGLVFGVVLVLGVLVGITFQSWPWSTIFFTTPGLIVIPDAWEGLRMSAERSWDRRRTGATSH